MSHLTLTLPDIIWIVMVVGGIAVSIVMLRLYHARLPVVATIKERPMRLLGDRMIADFTRAESFRLTSHVVSLLVGVIASLVDIPVAIRGMVIVVGLIIINGCSVANTFNAYISWKLRTKLVEELRKSAERNRT